MTDRPHYTGTLQKGEQPDTIEGTLTDWFGWQLHILGVRQSNGTYRLTATVGDKGALRIPLLDDDAQA